LPYRKLKVGGTSSRNVFVALGFNGNMSGAMNKMWERHRQAAGAWMVLLAALALGLTAKAADTFVWQSDQDKVEAQIEGWDLTKVLREIAFSTGWHIYLESDTQRKVSVKFKNLPPGEALRRLLNDLNFALLPQADGPSKLFVYRTSLAEATQLIAPPDRPTPEAKSSKAIPNELIVTLKPGSKKSIHELARQLGAKVVGGIDELNTYRLQFENESAAKSARELLASDGDVGGVDSNYAISPPSRIDRLQLSSPPPFTLKAKVSTDTSKIIVGLIDTPVQPPGGGMNDFLLPALHVAGDPGSGNGQLTHGTSMAETVLHGLSLASRDNGESPVRILPVDVYGSNPQTSTFDVAKGIYAAVDGGATIINLSLGGDGDSKYLANLIQDYRKSGVLFFGAAGNQPTTAATYPAAYPEVIAVTAGDSRGNLAPYASRGSFVDVIGPGASLVQFNGQSFLVSGTSAATAYVSGSAAGLRATGKNAAQVEAAIRENLAVIKPPAKPASSR
jgi:hypothetical protein